uniref:Fatty acid hydroxylase domain-containing protein n=2 Tax=Aplanochytrium stocchinoi TaxID=215587 RepID=A0A6S7ZRJ7_9STRA|mmetsp:Transcript_14024/g.18185  ORF Transcript_14024/g.18185 Transcript_14024/m.18185 type:complete len:493 (+) Transcript_14024:59-1537(+)
MSKQRTGKANKGEPSKESWLDGFLGTVDGSFFKAPKWVDLTKPPGTTDQSIPLQDAPDFWGMINGKNLFFTPNGVFFLLSVFVYMCFPYSYDNTEYNRVLHESNSAIISFLKVRMLPRLYVNMVMVYVYYFYWHGILYWSSFKDFYASRPFNPDRGEEYRYAKVVHNIFYTTLGTIQWTVWEAVFIHCFATDRLPYLKDSEAFSSPRSFASLMISILMLPVWRDVHFYCAHRFIHIKAIYKYVHSLHHRNTDIEPFAGLSMHPIEHLYYYSCFAPSLYLRLSPFFLLFNGYHLIIAPGASHSGYEDHFQADQMHYLHHRYFECNYGTPGFMMDRFFGTFRESLGVNSNVYKGEHVESKTNKLESNARRTDAKATLFGMPKWDEGLYNMIVYLVLPGAVILIARKIDSVRIALISGIIAAGPIVAAFFVAYLASRKSGSWRKKLLYPFSEESFAGQLGVHVIASFLFCMVPIFHCIQMLLSNPGEAVYFSIHQ